MKKSTKTIIQIVLVIFLILFGFAGLMTLNALKPPLEKKKPPVAMPMARTITVHTDTISVPIEGQGTVHPLQEIQLVPQVGGKVVFISPALVDGGEYQKGEVLLKIDPADYKIAVTLAEARVKDAESKFVMAQQESSVAKSDWHRLNPGAPAPPLVAKEPQLATAKANLAAQKAELERARLNLSRTQLKAPFDGRVSQKKVDIGQYISPGQAVATLYSIEAAEIVLPMESNHLKWFYVPGFTTGKKPIPGPAVSPSKTQMIEATRIMNIRVEKSGEHQIVIIEGDGRFKKPTPFFVDKNKLVMDFYGVTSDQKMKTIEVKGPILKSVRVADHKTPKQKTRIVMDLQGKSCSLTTRIEKTLQVQIKAGNETKQPHIVQSAELPVDLVTSQSANAQPPRDMVTKAIVKADIAGQEQTWEGTVVRAEGKVDELTRMINVVVLVNQPYAKMPPLAPGLFVTVNIQGRQIENGVIIPRAAIHQGEIVWVVNKENTLEFRPIEVALRSRAGVVVTSGLSDSEQVVVSPIKEVTNGMKVRNIPAINGGETL